MIALACVLVVSAGAFTSKKVTTEGMAAITGTDVASAREAAIKNAQKVAIEQVVGAYVESEFSADERASANDKGSSFTLEVRDRIVTKSDGFIEKQRVLAERRDGDVYRVSLEVEVRTASLADELKKMQSLLKAVGYPKLSVLAAERYAKKDGAAAVIANPTLLPLLEEALLRYGITVVGKQQTKQLQTNAEAMFAELDALEKGAGKIKALASDGAEVVITARADDKLTGFNEFNDNNYYVSSQVTLRAIETKGGTVLASVERNGKGIGANEEQARIKAVKSVAAELHEKLLQQLAQAWQQRADRGTRYQLVVAKVKNYAKTARPLLKALSANQKFSSVKEASFDESTLTIDVEFAGDQNALFDALFDEIASTPGLQKLSKKSVDGTRVFLSL